MKIGFTGFSTGNSVSVQANQAGAARAGTVSQWGVATGGRSVTIEIEAGGSGVAPLAAFLRAVPAGFSVSGLDAEHELDFRWDLGEADPISAALGLRSAALWGGDTNAAFTARTAQVYAGATARTATVWVSDGTYTVSASIIITPTSPDAVYDAAHTIYVDPDGTLDVQHAGAPAGALYTVTIAQARTKWLALSGGARIRLASGKTHASPGGDWDSARSLYADSYGIGAKPIVDLTAGPCFQIRDTVTDFRCVGIRFQGLYDVTTETGARIDAISGSMRYHNCVYDCEFDGCATGVYFALSRNQTLGEPVTTGYVAAVAHCVITDWQDFGVFCPDPLHFAVIGCRIEEDVNALPGGKGKDLGFRQHGCIRTSGVQAEGFTLIRMNEFFNNGGWNTGSHQPVTRHNSAGKKDAKLYMERNICEGQVSLDPGSGAANGHRQHVIFQMNVVIGDANLASGLLPVSFTGTTIRSNLFYIPNVRPEGTEPNIEPPINVTYGNDGAPTDADHLNGRLDILHNTVLDMRTNANATNSSTGNVADPRLLKQADPTTVYPNARVANTVLFGPNRSPAFAPSGSMDAAVLFAPRYAGKRTDPSTLDTAFATPAGTVIRGRPLAGAAALAAGLFPSATRDILGILRPAEVALRTAGAWEGAGAG